MSKKEKKKHKRPQILLNSKPKMFISNEVSEQIRYLHEKVGNNEWSGIIMLNVEGSIDNISNLIVNVEGIYPCNVGSGAYTKYKLSENFDAFDQFPEHDLTNQNKWDGIKIFNGPKIGQIHTHHSMNDGAYFSFTDVEDLHTNVNIYGFYISLIVAMYGRYVARGCYLAETSLNRTIKAQSFNSKLNLSPQVEETLIVFDFDIQFNTESWLINKVDQLINDRIVEEEVEYLEYAERINKRISSSIQKWSQKSNAVEFIPNINQKKIIKDSGFKHEYYKGFGNVYTDLLGKSFSDSGEELTEEELKDIELTHLHLS